MLPTELTGYTEFGVLGLTIVALMLALAWVVRQWMAERTKNNELQSARLGDAQKQIVEQAAIGEAMRITMAESTRIVDANTKAMEAVLRQIGNRQ